MKLNLAILISTDECGQSHKIQWNKAIHIKISYLKKNCLLVLIQHLYLENCHYTEYVAYSTNMIFCCFPAKIQ